MTRPAFDAARLERWLVHAIALHSLLVGAMLLLAPAWAARFGGFGEAWPLFFPRQAGIFHFVVVVGYLGEYHRHRGVSLLVTTKAIAVLFLGAAWLAGEIAWSVPLSALGDGAMGLAVALAHRARRRSAAAPGAAAPSSS